MLSLGSLLVLVAALYKQLLAISDVISLECGIRVEYSSDNGTLQMAVYGSTQGYLAIGFSTSNEMEGSDSVVGYFDSSPKTYYLATHDSIVVNDKLNIWNSSVKTINGTTSLHFSRSIYDGYNPVNSKGAFNLIGATGNVIGGNIRKHYCNTRSQNTIVVQSGTGDTKSDSSVNPIQESSWTSENFPLSEYQKKAIAHGSLMFFAFTFIFPSGIFIARIRKLVEKEIIFYHFIIQVTGFAFMTAATLIAYSMVTSHFSLAWHGIYGTIVIILVWIQVVGGILRPHIEKSQPVSMIRRIWERFHLFLGYLIIIVAIPNICIGVLIIGAPAWVLGIYGPIVFGVGLLLVILEFSIFFKRKEKIEINTMVVSDDKNIEMIKDEK